MIYNVIGSGSSGNAVILDKHILIDCGVPFKQLQAFAKGLRLVLLTHRHGDHFHEATIRRLVELRPTLRFAMCDWMIPFAVGVIQPSNIDIMHEGKEYQYDGFSVSPFNLVHDVPNCGWRIHLSDPDYKVLYATDTGTMDGVVAKDYHLYLLEANHDREELERRAKEKMDRGEYAYEIRAAANHMSKQQTDEWLMENAADWSDILYLHQHKEV